MAVIFADAPHIFHLDWKLFGKQIQYIFENMAVIFNFKITVMAVILDLATSQISLNLRYDMIFHEKVQLILSP